jgi:hypothetical protein
MNSRSQYIVAFVLMFIASLSRLIPHPLNFAPIAAIALFGGVYFDKKFALIVPLASLVISDYFLGFYSEIIWVYGSFALVGLLGLWLKNHKTIPMIAGTTFLGSIIFFIITNFGSWIMMTEVYSRSLSGIINCYFAAIPFYRNSLIGDLFYVAVLFGVYELVVKFAFKKSIASV